MFTRKTILRAAGAKPGCSSFTGGTAGESSDPMPSGCKSSSKP